MLCIALVRSLSRVSQLERSYVRTDSRIEMDCAHHEHLVISNRREDVLLGRIPGHILRRMMVSANAGLLKRATYTDDRGVTSINVQRLDGWTGSGPGLGIPILIFSNQGVTTMDRPTIRRQSYPQTLPVYDLSSTDSTPSQTYANMSSGCKCTGLDVDDPHPSFCCPTSSISGLHTISFPAGGSLGCFVRSKT